MRKPVTSLLTLLLLGGCQTYYVGVYATSSCGLENSQSTEIAREISQSLGVIPQMTKDAEGVPTIIIEPSPDMPARPIVPKVELVETSHGLFVNVFDNGDGSSPMSKRLKDVVQQTLRRHGCSSWRLDERTHGLKKM